MYNFAAVNLQKQKNEENEQQYLVVAQLEIQIIAGYVAIPIFKDIWEAHRIRGELLFLGLIIENDWTKK